MKKYLSFLILVLVLNFNCSAFAGDISKEILEEIEIAFSNKDYNKVIQTTNKIIKIDSTNSYLYKARAMANEQLCSETKCNYQSIIDDFSKAIKYDNHISDNNTSYLYMGRAHARFEIKEYENAIADYSIAINLNDFTNSEWSTLLFFQRAEARLKIEDYSGAIVDYTRVIKLNKRNDNFFKMISYIHRGNAYLEINEYKKAIKDATKAIKIDENCLSAYFLRGRAKAISLKSRNYNTTYDVMYNIKICESARQDFNIAKEYSLLQNDMESYKEILDAQKSVDEMIEIQRKFLNY